MMGMHGTLPMGAVEPQAWARQLCGSNIAHAAQLRVYVPFGLYLYFCPPKEASYINPPFATVNTAIPL
jgi:hypothetical protein